MNMILKTAIAGTLALAGSTAFATTAPSTGSSDLILIVQNTTNNNSYALDTGISVNTEFNGTFVSGAFLNTSLSAASGTINASSALLTFLAANPAAGDVWTLEAAQFPSNANNADSTPGAAKAIFTSGALNASSPASKTNRVLTTFNGFEAGLNGDFVTGGAPALAGLLTSTEITGNGMYTAAGQKKYNYVGAPDGSALGTPSVLFGLTGNGGTGAVQSYILGSVNLAANGTLTITGNTVSAVPLPAAVWLFGSGLMGLVGVSRRRKASV